MFLNVEALEKNDSTGREANRTRIGRIDRFASGQSGDANFPTVYYSFNSLRETQLLALH